MRPPGTETGAKDQGEGMSDYSDTPPTVPGTYWVKTRRSGYENPVFFCGRYWHMFGEYTSEQAAVRYQFGHRIPTNAELGELLGLIEEYGLRCKAYGLAIQSLGSDEQFGLRIMRDEMLAKINAILGVAE